MDKRIKERMHNLRDMAEDSSSPNEAAIAARRLEYMLRRYHSERSSRDGSVRANPCAVYWQLLTLPHRMMMKWWMKC